jgi:hypothetical protein
MYSKDHRVPGPGTRSKKKLSLAQNEKGSLQISEEHSGHEKIRRRYGGQLFRGVEKDFHLPVELKQCQNGISFMVLKREMKSTTKTFSPAVSFK